MKTQTVCLQLLSIVLMLTLGSVMLSLNLPGWSLIAAAALLALFTSPVKMIPARIPVNRTPRR